MTTKMVGAHNQNPNDGCGSSIACVKVGVPSTSDDSTDGPGKHLRNLWLVIEEPAYECRTERTMTTCAANKHIRIYWAKTLGEDETKVVDPITKAVIGEKYYIGSLLIHEFGHTFGLPDFENYTSLKYEFAVMNNFHKYPTIRIEDISQLSAIYAVHDSTDHD